MSRHEGLARRRAGLVRVGIVLLAALLAPPAIASAAEVPAFGVSTFDASATSTQAGAHPDYTTSFSLATDALGNPIQQIKDAQIQLPAGVIGNPLAVPRCSSIDFQSFKCPPNTQVGVIEPSFIVACHGVQTTLGYGGVGQLPPTVLTEAVAAGESTLTVESTANMQSGDNVTIDVGGNEETATATVIDSTHIALSNGVQQPYPVGTPLADDVITVASTAGFCNSEDHSITVGNGASAETDTIAYIEAPHRLNLQAPLVHEHALGELVTHVASTHQGPLAIFNLEPSPGHVATLGVSLLLASIYVQVDLRDGGRNGLTASFNDVSTLLGFTGSRFTLWGVPAESSHDAVRCGELGLECQAAKIAPLAFVTNPTNCSAPLTTTISVDSWQDPGHFVSTQSTLPAPTGCELLRMSPSISVSTDTPQADSPAGYTIDLKLPQNEDPLGLATPTLKTVSLTLPVGTSLSPSGAVGLEACTDAQVGEGGCPGASTIGTASIASPALPDHLEGRVYLAAPTAAEMYRVFVVASDDSVTVRLTGQIHPDPATGQLTIVFEEAPQFPLSDFQVSFFGGPSASLANPPTCGTAVATSQLTTYAGQTAAPQSSFVVAADSKGADCPATQPFSPQVTAGTIAPLADAFSPFTLTISREDEQQNLSSLTAQLPAGLLGMLSRVPACAEPQATAGTCSAASRIGSAFVAAGAGDEPLHLPGSIYLTKQFRGAPFGLSIVVPAAAGPFDLGTIVVRARVLVDPKDMHLTVISDPLPEILAGIPLRVRTISLTLDRPGFIFNPTNCAAQAVVTTLGAAQGANALSATPFRLAGCSALAFAPRLTASTQAKASAGGNGARLDLTIINHTAVPVAGIRSSTVTLPSQLRPRLTTIEQACPSATFFGNRSDCAPGSHVGIVTVHTPTLSSALTGPIYLVSRGGRTYPELILILQGEGLTVEIDGKLSISKSGTITAGFTELPDVPISSFYIQLPSGLHSMLGATASLCSGKLLLPYTLVGQNGAKIHQVARASVNGCHRHRKSSTRKSVRRKSRKPGRRRTSGHAA
jgi:hypothetical protein